MGASSPHVIVVGGGFGGLAAAKALKHTPAHITLIDHTNHHLFQPLLYQVATSELAPGQIGSPIRNIPRKQSNATIISSLSTPVTSNGVTGFMAKTGLYIATIQSTRCARRYRQ